MRKLLIDKIAIVTGASRGIGRAIAVEYARAGSHVIVNATKESEDLETTVKLIRSHDRSCEIVIGSVSEKETGEALVASAMNNWGRVDILVNNAGITIDKPLMFMSDEDWDSVLSVNLTGVFQCTRSTIRPMMQQRNGRIITISSISAISGRPGQTNYAAAKAGISGFTKSLARELGQFNVLVNGLLVGAIDTQMTKKMPAKQLQSLKKNIPLGRLGSVEDVAGPCVFLGSDLSKYVTGAMINVSGGSYI